MKIMYFITTMHHGRGGHIYSLRTTVDGLKVIINPLVINIGKIESPILKPINHTYLYCNGWNFFTALLRLIKLVKREKPKVLHPFDVDSLFFARCISFIFKIPIIYTKCGGENPKKYYPFVRNIILYSNENLDFFKTKSKYIKSNLYLIPNRVNKIKKDNNRINLIKEKIDSNKKIFLRIARFAPAYVNSMKESIDLIQLLNQGKEVAQLIIIGAIQDKSSHTEIKNYILKKKYVYIFTDNLFTINASEIIDIADFIIGTGRGLMEGASFKKTLLTPMKESSYPILVNQTNFMTFFYTNFSPRNKLKNFNQENNIENILKSISNKSIYIEFSEYSFDMYEKYFNIHNSLEKYNKIYNEVKYDTKTYIFDFMVHFTMFIKHYLYK